MTWSPKRRCYLKASVEFSHQSHVKCTMTLEEVLIEYDQLPEYLVSSAGCVSVSAKSGFGNFPINIAAARGMIDEVTILLKNGSDINQVGEHGYTPLHEAVEQGFLEVVRLLLAHGADTEIKNDDGDTAFDHATLMNEQQIAILLEK